eukprot:12459036-Alexandrium_andersonii.AAC.1
MASQLKFALRRASPKRSSPFYEGALLVGGSGGWQPPRRGAQESAGYCRDLQEAVSSTFQP